MSARRLVVLVLVITLLAVIVRPAPAHADILVVAAIAGAVVVVILIVGLLVIANMEGHKSAESTPPATLERTVVAYSAPDTP